MSAWSRLLWVFLFTGCGGPTQLPVRLTPLPETASSVRLIITRDGRPADLMRPSFGLGDLATRDRVLDLVLDLPPGDPGSGLRIAAGVFHKDGCLIAVGEGQSGEDGAAATVPLAEVPGCPGKSGQEPILIRATPGRVVADGGDALTLSGFGFTSQTLPALTWRDGELPLAEYSWGSPLSLTARVPALPPTAPRDLVLRLPAPSAAALPIRTYDRRTTLSQEVVYGLPAGQGPAGIAVGDVDRDGAPDLLVLQIPFGGYSPAEQLLYFNQGNGALRPPQSIQQSKANGFVLYQVFLADLDNDGAVDLITKRNDGLVEVSFNRQRGPGQNPFPDEPDQRFTLPSTTDFAVVTDADGDQRPDLIVSLASSTDQTTQRGLLRTYRDHFGERRSRQDALGLTSECLLLGKAQNAVMPAVADVDGDGRTDVAVAFDQSPFFTVLSGAGCQRPRDFVPTGFPVVGLAFGDVEGRGRQDLFVISNEPRGPVLTWHRADDQGGFAAGVALNLSPYFGPGVVDLNGDGRPELVITAYDAPRTVIQLSVHHNQGGGAFAQGAVRTIGSNPGRPLVADLNGDGRPDIIQGTYGAKVGDPGMIKIFFNQPERTP